MSIPNSFSEPTIKSNSISLSLIFNFALSLINKYSYKITEKKTYSKMLF